MFYRVADDGWLERCDDELEDDDEEQWDPDDVVIPTPPPRLVTSGEQLADALAIPRASIFEPGPLPLSYLLGKAREKLEWLVGIVPQGKERP